MDAVKYLKDRERLCKNACACKECSFWKIQKCRCEELEKSDPEKAVKFVEKWSKENPAKTRQSEFLRLFPNAPLDCNGVSLISPCHTDSNIGKNCRDWTKCDRCREEYWSKEVE